MANTETISSNSTAKPLSTALTPEPLPLKRFELLLQQRMKGTVTVFGDIISPDPELSVAERD